MNLQRSLTVSYPIQIHIIVSQQESVQQYDFGVEPSDSLAAREVLAAIVSSGSSDSSSGSQSMWERCSGNSVPPTTLVYVQ